MPGDRQGFTLLELIIAISIMGILFAIAVPKVGSDSSKKIKKEFVSKINLIVRLAWQNSLITGKIHEVRFDLVNRTIQIRVKSDKKNDKKSEEFENLEFTDLHTSYSWPVKINIKQFFVEGEDKIATFGLGEKQELVVWFYIIPDGFSQRVVINLSNDTGQNVDEFSMVLNPFNAQFKEYESFQIA